MTPEEKIIFYIRESLIEQYGDAFLESSEEDQTIIICDELQKYFKHFRNGK